MVAEHGRRIAGWHPIVRGLAVGAGALTGTALAGGVLIGWVTAQVLTHPRPTNPYDDYTITPHETHVEYEDVRFLARDREHALRGWWLPRPESQRVIICCHGYRGGKFELVGIASSLWRAGFNVLMFDFNNHRPGHAGPVTLGFDCVDDLMGAIDYAKERVPGAVIGALGYSMGASVVILGAARSQDIRAVVSDTPFSTHAAVVAHGVRRLLHIPGEPFMPFTDFFLKRRAGYRHRDVEPVRDVAAIAPRPFLLIHGTEDSISPVDQGYAVYAAAREPKELWIAEGAEHCGAYFVDRLGYTRRLVDWFERNLPATSATQTAPTTDSATHEDDLSQVATLADRAAGRGGQEESA